MVDSVRGDRAQALRRIRVVAGDITTQRVDAIVNAANSSLLGGGGVDGAIHRAAGPELRAHCAGLGGCPTGEARVTPGFGLAAKWIIHTVGPVWHGGQHGEDAALARCYRNSLGQAVAHGVTTIAIPQISTGAYGFPLERACAIAVREVVEFLAHEPSIEEVRLMAFSRDAEAALVRALEAAEPPKPAAGARA
jgi:O-acetyl-ADP-ribose deacetylase (regulator of RNase III)